MKLIGGFVAVCGIFMMAYVLGFIVVGIIGMYVGGIGIVASSTFLISKQLRDYGPGMAALATVASLCVAVPTVIGAIAAPEMAGMWKFWFNRLLEISGPQPDPPSVILFLITIFWIAGGGVYVGVCLDRIFGDSESKNTITLMLLFIAAWGITAGWTLGWLLGGIPKAMGG